MLMFAKIFGVIFILITLFAEGVKLKKLRFYFTQVHVCLGTSANTHPEKVNCKILTYHFCLFSLFLCKHCEKFQQRVIDLSYKITENFIVKGRYFFLHKKKKRK